MFESSKCSLFQVQNKLNEYRPFGSHAGYVLTFYAQMSNVHRSSHSGAAF